MSNVTESPLVTLAANTVQPDQQLNFLSGIIIMIKHTGHVIFKWVRQLQETLNQHNIKREL